MNILSLYPFLPWPANTGGKIRGSIVLDALSAAHAVTFVSFYKRGESPADLMNWPAVKRFSAQPICIDRASSDSLTPAGAELRSRLPSFPMGLPSWAQTTDRPSMWNALAQLDLEQFDTIHIRYGLMLLYAMALSRKAPRMRVVVDLDDIPSVVAMRDIERSLSLTRQRANLWKWKDAVRTFLYESRALRQCDSVWICSELDRKKIARRIGDRGLRVIPNVVDVEKLSSISRTPEPHTVLFVGDFNYAPNLEGAFFLLDRVWPLVRAQCPAAELWLVGPNWQDALLARDRRDGVHITGVVDSVQPFLGRAAVSVAPIMSGGGTRLKILEAFAARIPVVATRLGAEGLGATHEKHLLLADSPVDFAAACLRILRDQELGAELAAAAGKLVAAKYDLGAMRTAVLDAYTELESRERPADGVQ